MSFQYASEILPNIRKPNQKRRRDSPQDSDTPNSHNYPFEIFDLEKSNMNDVIKLYKKCINAFHNCNVKSNVNRKVVVRDSNGDPNDWVFEKVVGIDPLYFFLIIIKFRLVKDIIDASPDKELFEDLKQVCIEHDFERCKNIQAGVKQEPNDGNVEKPGDYGESDLEDWVEKGFRYFYNEKIKNKYSQELKDKYSELQLPNKRSLNSELAPPLPNIDDELDILLFPNQKYYPTHICFQRKGNELNNYNNLEGPIAVVSVNLFTDRIPGSFLYTYTLCSGQNGQNNMKAMDLLQYIESWANKEYGVEHAYLSALQYGIRDKKGNVTTLVDKYKGIGYVEVECQLSKKMDRSNFEFEACELLSGSGVVEQQLLFKNIKNIRPPPPITL